MKASYMNAIKFNRLNALAERSWKCVGSDDAHLIDSIKDIKMLERRRRLKRDINFNI